MRVIKQRQIILWNNYINVLSIDSLSQLRDCLLRYKIFWRRCQGRSSEFFPWVLFIFPLVVQRGGNTKLCFFKIILAPKRPHTRSNTSQQKAHVLSDLEKLVSKKGQEKKYFLHLMPHYLYQPAVHIHFHPRIFLKNSFSRKKNPHLHPFIFKNQC